MHEKIRAYSVAVAGHAARRQGVWDGARNYYHNAYRSVEQADFYEQGYALAADVRRCIERDGVLHLASI